MGDQFVIGIDLGGTNCRAGVVDRHGAILARAHRLVRDRSPDDIVALLADIVTELRQGHREIVGIGVGAAGLVDYARGRVRRSPHFPEWVDFPLRDRLRDRLHLPARLDNDVNVIALGEAKRGAARPYRDCCMITLGTGIGGAIWWDGKLLRGDSGGAGEVGHMTIDYAGPACPCGGAGCWERYASASAFPELIRQLAPSDQTVLRGCTPRAADEMARAGNPSARRLWERFGYFVGVGLASLVNVVGIHHVIVGGGLTGAWDHYIDAAWKGIRAHTYAETAAAIQLHRAALGDDAGIIGAARLREHH